MAVSLFRRAHLTLFVRWMFGPRDRKISTTTMRPHLQGSMEADAYSSYVAQGAQR